MSLKPRTRTLLERAIEAGIEHGLRRAMKHRDSLQVTTSDELIAALKDDLQAFIALHIEEDFYCDDDETVIG